MSDPYSRLSPAEQRLARWMAEVFPYEALASRLDLMEAAVTFSLQERQNAAVMDDFTTHLPNDLGGLSL